MASESHTITRPQFQLRCAPHQKLQGEWLADVAQATQPKAGSTVQVGWSILKFLPLDGSLMLCEPDFAGKPFSDFRPSVAATLRVLDMQNSVLKRAACEPKPWRFDEKVVLRRGALDSTRIRAERQQPKAGDSGWYIDVVSNQVDAPAVENLEALWAYELLDRRPEVLAAFALPVGWMAFWNGVTLETLVDSDNVVR